MKPFKVFIKESFMIARSNMPQIEDVEKFTEWLADDRGVGSWPYYDLVTPYSPLQAEGFDEGKIKDITMDLVEDPESIPDMKPIIISDDGYVVDGHHRYLAAMRLEVKFPYIVVYTSANKLLKLAYEYESLTD